MQKIEVVLKFMKHIVWALVFEGILSIAIGILIFFYPALLGMLVGILLVVSGIFAFVLAAKVNKYSAIKFDI